MLHHIMLVVVVDDAIMITIQTVCMYITNPPAMNIVVHTFIHTRTYETRKNKNMKIYTKHSLS